MSTGFAIADGLALSSSTDMLTVNGNAEDLPAAPPRWLVDSEITQRIFEFFSPENGRTDEPGNAIRSPRSREAGDRTPA